MTYAELEQLCSDLVERQKEITEDNQRALDAYHIASQKLLIASQQLREATQRLAKELVTEHPQTEVLLEEEHPLPLE